MRATFQPTDASESVRVPQPSHSQPRDSSYQKSSTAPDCSDEQRRFRVTHPFHPLCGQEFDLIWYAYAWGEERVHYEAEDGRAVSLPASWTDILPPDPFVAISAGRSWFRVEDLVELVNLLRDMSR